MATSVAPFKLGGEAGAQAVAGLAFGIEAGGLRCALDVRAGIILYLFAYPKRRSEIMATAALDWSDCPLVEVIPGKVSGAPLLKNTRLPVDAITGNYDAFRDEGLSPDAAIAETLDCYPEAGLDAIKAILSYRAAH
jgi:uncharacterized protein (DUF433 family)